MQKAANLVRGWVELQVVGADCPEFLNLCARMGLPFWGVTVQDETTLRLRLPWRCRKRALGLGGGRWEVTLRRRGGIPGFFRGLRYRYGLLAGLVLTVAAVAVLSRTVLTVRVEGSVKVPASAILTQLRAAGLRPGAYGPRLDTRDIANRVMLEVPELSWMSINLHGTVASVLVREGDPRPELMEEEAPAHIEAKYTGIVTHVEAVRGMALVEKGDTVVAGDTLISSWVDFEELPGITQDWGGMRVRAAGRVEARTWHTLEAAIPLSAERKVPTGEKKTRWSLEILGHRVKFYRNTGIPQGEYDKITTYHPLRLPNGTLLPFALKKEVWSGYERERTAIDEGAAEALLRAQLAQRLDGMVGEGEVLKTDYRARRRDGLLTVTLLAECREEIGITIEERE